MKSLKTLLFICLDKLANRLSFLLIDRNQPLSNMLVYFLSTLDWASEGSGKVWILSKEVNLVRKCVEVLAKPGYVLEVLFDNDVRGQICIKERLFGPMFEPLKDPDFFAKAKVDQFGVICWPNGADLDPENLYRSLT